MEEYFSKFPIVAYDFSTDKEKIAYLLRDITKNVRFRKEILKEISLYDYYDIMDGETPEIISNKVYGTPFYHWIIMLANESYDWINDYPLTDQELTEYIEEKYGSIQEANQKTQHYVNLDGEIVYFNPSTPEFNYYYGYDEDGILKRIVPNKTWSSGISVNESDVIVHADKVYSVYQAGNLGNSGPTHVSGTVLNGSAQLLYVGSAPKKISCYDYEIAVNESKRKIKVISPRIISTVLTNFRDLI